MQLCVYMLTNIGMPGDTAFISYLVLIESHVSSL